MKVLGGLIRFVCVITLLAIVAVILKDLATQGHISETVWAGLGTAFNTVTGALQGFADTFLKAFQFQPAT